VPVGFMGVGFVEVGEEFGVFEFGCDVLLLAQIQIQRCSGKNIRSVKR
jgi:hypothetical protein